MMVARDDGLASPMIGRRRFLELVGATGALTAGAGLLGRSGVARAASPGPVVMGAADPVADLAAGLGYDLARIARWVSDEIAYEPYAGTLRGARGTLDARAGNSVDQARLLGALLDASLIRWRFAEGPIEPGFAATLAGSTRIDLATARARAEQVLVKDALVAGRPQPVELSPEVKAFVDSLSPDAAQIVPTTSGQLDRTVALLVDALTQTGAALPEATLPSLPDLEITRHTWVQAQQGPGWVDLAPTLPDSQPGMSPAAVTTTWQGPMPDELRHRVDFVATVESVSAGALASVPVVEQSAWVDELVDVPVTFSNLKPDGFAALGVSIGGIVGGGGRTQYNSVLTIGPRSFIGTTPIVFGAGELDPFGDAASPSPGVGEGEGTAQWLEVTVTSPGHEPVTQRRTIFDRVGAAARGAGTVDLSAIPPVTLVDLSTLETAEYPPVTTSYVFSVLGGAMNGRNLVAAARPDDPAVIGRLPRDFHHLRDALAADLLLERGVRVFADGPNIVSWVTQNRATSSDDLVVTEGVDLWHRSMATAPIADREATAPAALLAGVLPQQAERLSLREGFATIAGTARRVISVGAILDAADDQGIQVRVLTGSLPQDVELPGEARDRVAAALAAGEIVVVPERPVDLGGAAVTGWWRIDPATGTTRDESETGAGAAMVEEEIQVTRAVRLANCFIALGEKIFALEAIAAKLLGDPDWFVGGIGVVAVGWWTLNFFNQGYAKTCRG